MRKLQPHQKQFKNNKQFSACYDLMNLLYKLTGMPYIHGGSYFTCIYEINQVRRVPRERNI